MEHRTCPRPPAVAVDAPSRGKRPVAVGACEAGVQRDFLDPFPEDFLQVGTEVPIPFQGFEGST